MTIEELQKFIQKLGPELYSFTYVLIPDDLQTTQLMIDCIQSYLILNKTLIEKNFFPKNKISSLSLNEIKWQLFKTIFDLAKKRYQQLKISFQSVENKGGFFSLEFNEKTVLYLKDKLGLSIEQIELISDFSSSEILSHLYIARKKMIEMMPSELLCDQELLGGMN